MNIKAKILEQIARLGYRVTKEPIAPSTNELDFEITYLDVGSSGGLPPKWQRYAFNEFFNLILVEPDAAETQNLKSRYPKATIVPHALGKSRAKSILNVARFPSCSSLLEPDFEILNQFPVKKWFEIEKKIEVELYPFSSLAEELKLKTPDFIKMDVQGYESEILQGFGQHLDSVLCLELETHLFPIYKNQMTIEGVSKFLKSKGFFLRHLSPTGIFEDEVIEFDAFYTRMPHLLKSDIDKKKIDFWTRVNKLPSGNYFKDWDKF